MYQKEKFLRIDARGIISGMFAEHARRSVTMCALPVIGPAGQTGVMKYGMYGNGKAVVSELLFSHNDLLPDWTYNFHNDITLTSLTRQIANKFNLENRLTMLARQSGKTNMLKETVNEMLRRTVSNNVFCSLLVPVDVNLDNKILKNYYINMFNAKYTKHRELILISTYLV